MHDGGAVDEEAGGGQQPGPGACRYFSLLVVHGTVQLNNAGELRTKDLYVGGGLIVIRTFTYCQYVAVALIILLAWITSAMTR